MLVHFIGDLHQPLHVGRGEDKGGNDIQVRWFNDGSNLWTNGFFNAGFMGLSTLQECQAGGTVWEDQGSGFSCYNAANGNIMAGINEIDCISDDDTQDNNGTVWQRDEYVQVGERTQSDVRYQGEYNFAKDHYEKALEITKRTNNQQNQLMYSENLGQVALQQNDLGEAEKHFNLAHSLLGNDDEEGGATNQWFGYVIEVELSGTVCDIFGFFVTRFIIWLGFKSK